MSSHDGKIDKDSWKLYFFIYDKENLISDAINFQNTYEKKMRKKKYIL